MGNIRNSHISPGIYTSIRSVSRNKPRIKDAKAIGGYGNQGGGGKPIPIIWVFGNFFPAVFT